MRKEEEESEVRWVIGEKSVEDGVDLRGKRMIHIRG